ncbi:MAG: hypothetical protein EHM45_23370, partial [Desulfobacteraceae bacterium]
MSNRIEIIRAARKLTNLDLAACKQAVDQAGGDLETALRILQSPGSFQAMPGQRFKTTGTDVPPSLPQEGRSMRVFISQEERALLYRRGDYVRLLKPGRHFIIPFLKYQVERHNLNQAFRPPQHPAIYLRDPDLEKELLVMDIPDHQIALHFEDGHFIEVLQSGRHLFWKALKQHAFKAADLTRPEIQGDLDPALLNQERLTAYLSVHTVEPHEQGLLFYNEEFQRILSPGRYYFWKGSTAVRVLKADMRVQVLDMTGQEIMTRDKVAIRINFICQYQITHPRTALVQLKAYEEQVYILMQLILREYVGTLTLDELLEKKEEIGGFVLEKIREKSESLGLQFIYAGVKDIILPGEIRAILNKVIEAEKNALANIITRREET